MSKTNPKKPVQGINMKIRERRFIRCIALLKPSHFWFRRAIKYLVVLGMMKSPACSSHPHGEVGPTRMHSILEMRAIVS